MKRKLLAISSALVFSATYAQLPQRTVLYEEFTGENCPPCAATNPGLNSLLLGAPVNTQVIAIKWQVPIPSAPSNTWSLYQTDKTEINWRWQGKPSNYGYTDYGQAAGSGIQYAPQGRIDGQNTNIFGTSGSSPDHPANLTAGIFATAYTYTTPFSMTITPTWDAAYNNPTLTIAVKAWATYTTAGPFVLRTVLVERQIHWPTAPGSNGEKDFYDPVRKSYPTIQSGLSLPTSWTSGQIQTYTLACPIPTYIHDKSQMAFVSFLQDDATQKVWQTSRTATPLIPNDIAVTSVSGNAFSCANTYSANVNVSNVGPNAITSLTITPSIDGVPQTPYVIGVNIAAAGTSVVALPSYSTTGGSHTFGVNITGVSGGDANLNNNTGSTSFALVQTYYPAPLQQSFTLTAFPPANWFLNNPSGGTSYWSRSSVGNPGGSGSANYDFYSNGNVGTFEELYLAPSNLSGVSNPTLTFDVAYAQYSNETDTIKVLTSTDCGATWTQIYMKSGSTLATAPSYSSGIFSPSASQWRHEVVALPASASNNASVLVKFVAATDYGNDAYIDNVNLGVTTVSGLKQLLNPGFAYEMYPNPANEQTTLQINSGLQKEAALYVYNVTGQLVLQKQININPGLTTVDVDTRNLASGIYNVVLVSDNIASTKKLTVTK